MKAAKSNLSLNWATASPPPPNTISISTFKPPSKKAAYALAQSVLGAFGDSIRVSTEEHGLRLYEDRGLDGFVDGTENPQGDDNVRNVAIIPEGKPDAGAAMFCCKNTCTI